MRRVGDLLKDLGFNKDAPIETQKAFVRHMLQAAENSRPAPIPAAAPTPPEPEPVPSAIQLSFDPNVLGFSAAAEPGRRKIKTQR